MQQEKLLVITFPKTSIVTKFSLSAHPSKGPPQFLPLNPNPQTVQGLIDMAFEIKKNHLTRKTNEEALQIGPKGIELVSRHASSSS